MLMPSISEAQLFKRRAQYYPVQQQPLYYYPAPAAPTIEQVTQQQDFCSYLEDRSAPPYRAPTKEEVAQNNEEATPNQPVIVAYYESDFNSY